MTCERSTFSQEQVADCSPTSSSAIPPSPPSSGMPIAAPSCASEPQTDGSPACACTRETFGCSIHPNTPNAWIASQRASLARIYPLLAAGPESTAKRAAYGRKWSGWRPSFARVFSCSKTARQLSIEGLRSSYTTCPPWGSMRAGVRSPQAPLVPRTFVLDGSASQWQTPISDDAVQRVAGKWNSRGEPKLSAQVLLPTPTATNAKQGANSTAGGSSAGRPLLPMAALTWPTPTAGAQERNSRPLSEQIGGQLNPTWVEWLMAWPLGWTGCARLATAKSRSKSPQRGDCSEGR